MNEKEISNTLYTALKDYGAIKWHKTNGHSFYIKFKDVRLGSIRISNHQGRHWYSYTYEINVHDKDIHAKICDIVRSVIAKSKTLYGYNPEAYFVWCKETNKYKIVKTFKEYKESILTKF